RRLHTPCEIIEPVHVAKIVHGDDMGMIEPGLWCNNKPCHRCRFAGQPAATHFSITSRRQRIRRPSLTRPGKVPELANRHTWRLLMLRKCATSVAFSRPR